MSAAASVMRHRPKGKFYNSGHRCREDKDAPRRVRLTKSGRKKRHLRPGEVILGRCECGGMVRGVSGIFGRLWTWWCDSCTPRQKVTIGRPPLT